MKSSEIQVGVEYAYSTSAASFPALRLLKVMVLSEPQRGGVEVQFDDRPGSTCVRVQKIIRTWADNEQFAAQERERDRALNEQRQQAVVERNEAHRRLTALLPDEALPYWAHSTQPPARTYTDMSGIYGLSTDRFSVSDLEKVVEAAYQAGLDVGRQNGYV